MDLEATLARVKVLTEQREQIDAELSTIFGGTAPPSKRAPPVCSHCNETGHRSNSCPNKQA